MSSIWSDFQRRNTCYSDGITKVIDPFWRNTCQKCGKVYMSCDAMSACPICGCSEAERYLGTIPYEQVIAERGKPKSGFIRVNQNKSEFIREYQNKSE